MCQNAFRGERPRWANRRTSEGAIILIGAAVCGDLQTHRQIFWVSLYLMRSAYPCFLVGLSGHSESSPSRQFARILLLSLGGVTGGGCGFDRDTVGGHPIVVLRRGIWRTGLVGRQRLGWHRWLVDTVANWPAEQSVKHQHEPRQEDHGVHAALQDIGAAARERDGAHEQGQEEQQRIDSVEPQLHWHACCETQSE